MENEVATVRVTFRDLLIVFTLLATLGGHWIWYFVTSVIYSLWLLYSDRKRNA